MTSITDSIRLRIKLAGFIWIPIAVYLIGRFFVVQVLDHDYFLAEAKKRYLTERTTTGRRGEIYDRSGYLLVGNAPCRDIFCTPANLPEKYRRPVAMVCAKHFGKPAQWFYQRLAPKVKRKSADGTVKLVPSQYFMINRQTPLNQVGAFNRDLMRIFLTEKEIKAGKTSAKRFPRGFIGYRNSSVRSEVWRHHC